MAASPPSRRRRSRIPPRGPASSAHSGAVRLLDATQAETAGLFSGGPRDRETCNCFLPARSISGRPSRSRSLPRSLARPCSSSAPEVGWTPAVLKAPLPRASSRLLYRCCRSCSAPVGCRGALRRRGRRCLGSTRSLAFCHARLLVSATHTSSPVIFGRGLIRPPVFPPSSLRPPPPFFSPSSLPLAADPWPLRSSVHLHEPYAERGHGEAGLPRGELQRRPGAALPRVSDS